MSIGPAAVFSRAVTVPSSLSRAVHAPKAGHLVLVVEAVGSGNRLRLGNAEVASGERARGVHGLDALEAEAHPAAVRPREAERQRTLCRPRSPDDLETRAQPIRERRDGVGENLAFEAVSPADRRDDEQRRNRFGSPRFRPSGRLLSRGRG